MTEPYYKSLYLQQVVYIRAKHLKSNIVNIWVKKGSILTYTIVSKNSQYLLNSHAPEVINCGSK